MQRAPSVSERASERVTRILRWPSFGTSTVTRNLNAPCHYVVHPSPPPVLALPAPLIKLWCLTRKRAVFDSTYSNFQCNKFAAKLLFQDTSTTPMPLVFAQLISRTRLTFLLSKNRLESRAIPASALIITAVASSSSSSFIPTSSRHRFHDSEINFLAPSMPRIMDQSAH